MLIFFGWYFVAYLAILFILLIAFLPLFGKYLSGGKFKLMERDEKRTIFFGLTSLVAIILILGTQAAPETEVYLLPVAVMSAIPIIITILW